MNKNSLLLFAAIFLQGCLGITVGTFSKMQTPSESYTFNNNRHQTNLKNPNTSISKEELINLLGKPHSVGTYRECTTLTYKDGLSWSGIWMYLIAIPIPLGIPTGTNENIFYFRNGKSVGLIEESTEEDYVFGYMCGSLDCGFLAGQVYTFTGLPHPSRKATIDWCD